MKWLMSLFERLTDWIRGDRREDDDWPDGGER